jgi:hypothetical protein
MKRNAGSVIATAGAAAAIFAMVAGCTGCLWLAIPSLAYEGYKYESPASKQSKSVKPHQNSPPQGQDDIE